MRQMVRASRLGKCHSTKTSPPLSLNSTSPLIRRLAGPSNDTDHAAIQRDFQFWPSFFTEEESSELLQMALWKLNRADTTRRRKRKGKADQDHERQQGLQELFEGEYGFEEVSVDWSAAYSPRSPADFKGHYDSVIHDYRETLLSSLPPSPPSSLISLLTRLYSVLPALDVDPDSLPPSETSTHLLHLSPNGAILPHVDNLEASGSVILGLSLGAERTMRLKKKDAEGGWELKLPSGSVYLQR